MKNYKRYYDKAYVESYKAKEGEGRIEKILEHIKFDNNMKVLDVGCGNGFLASLVALRVKEYKGIDVSPEFIEAAKKRVRIPNCDFVCTELTRFSQNAKKHYDLIFLLDVTEHVPDFDLVPMLKAIRKLLKQDGYLVLHTPNSEYVLEKLKSFKIFPQTAGHIAVRNSREYMLLLKKAGLNNIEVIRQNHYNKLLSRLFLLSKLPLIGHFFVPRLLIKASI